MTPIRDVDISRPLAPLDGLDGCERCLLTLRWRRRVVGRAWAAVADGRISATRLADIVRGALDREALDVWLHEQVGFDPRAAEQPVPLTATVAICTHERPDDLARALDGVMGLLATPLDVLVIDNAPATDATAAVVARYPGIRCVREDRRGLDAARNRALREARGDIVAFTDDDAVPEPEWLDGLLANFQDPRVACATGLALPLELETDGQELFERHCSFVRSCRRRVFDGQHDNPLAVGPVGAGVNMAVRRDLALALGGFDERLDGGMPTRSGGDHDLFVRLLSAGHSIVYDPAAVVRHRHRRSVEEVYDAVYGYGVGVYAMWTGLLVERREIGVLKLAWQWLTDAQLPEAWRASDPAVRRLRRSELRGCLHGPAAWLRANRMRRAG